MKIQWLTALQAFFENALLSGPGALVQMYQSHLLHVFQKNWHLCRSLYRFKHFPNFLYIIKSLVYRCCRDPKITTGSILKSCSKLSLLCSYSIYCARKEPSWSSPHILTVRWLWFFFLHSWFFFYFLFFLTASPIMA